MSELVMSTQSTFITTEPHTTTDPSIIISIEPFTWPQVSTTESPPIEPTVASSQVVLVVTQTQTDASTFSTSTSPYTSASPTSSSTYDAANAISTPTARAQSTGLSAGTSAGIGVGVAIGVLLLALAVFLIYRYNRKRRTFAQEDSGREDAYPELPELAIDGQKYELEAEENEKPAELAAGGDRPKNGQTEKDTHELE